VANTLSKKERLLAALRNGKAFTASQIKSQFGFASKNSVYRDGGWELSTSENREGNLRYSLR
jgi:hypothetical protein